VAERWGNEVFVTLIWINDPLHFKAGQFRTTHPEGKKTAADDPAVRAREAHALAVLS
jgi:hypothetical protein